jgi:hypothetical protein
VFVYEKADDPQTATGNLNVLHTIFVSKEWTADFQTTTGLHRILENDGNKDDILAFIEERRLPVDEIEASAIADEILSDPPKVRLSYHLECSSMETSIWSHYRESWPRYGSREAGIAMQ